MLGRVRSSVSPGTTIAGYRVLSAVGEGAMSAVLVAERLDTGEHVALKLLDPELAHDDRFRARFLRESQIAAELDHPNAVRVFDSGEADGFLYLAMALVDGADLRELLRREGRLEPERAVELVDQVAGALDSAHAAGLIHRDVKPANILVGSDGQAVICDFGLARHVSSTASLTSDRAFVGTIDYVPPEQIEGGAVDGRADVYSLGCVLYECLAGERPFERESELSVLFAHLNEPPPAISAVRPELRAFDGVFAGALAKSPDDRFATCGELVGASEAALRGEAFAHKRSRRRRWVIAAALAAAVAAVAGVLATRGGGPRGAAAAPPLALHANSLDLVDAAARTVLARIPVPGGVSDANGGVDVATTPHTAWVLLVGKQRLMRLDLRTHRVLRSTKLPWYPGFRVATGGGFVWVSKDGGPEVIGVDQRTGKITRRFSVDGGNAIGMAYGAGSLWLAQGTDIARIDPATGKVTAKIEQRPGQVGELEWLVFSGGYLWGAGPDGWVRKYDPGANQVVTQTHLDAWIGDIAVDRDVWVTSTLNGGVDELNWDDLSPGATLPAGTSPERLSLGGGYVWVSSPADNALLSISEADGSRRKITSTAKPKTALYHNGLLLTASEPIPAPLPPVGGQEIRIAIPQSPLHFDPASPYTALDRALRYATCANLMIYPDEGGAAGSELRPEVAAGLPSVSADGRTYTFRIRPGFRFSPPSNQEVTAATFKYTLHRAFAPTYSGWNSDVAANVSRISARGDTLSITLKHADGAFLTQLSQPQFCPVPIGTPVYHDSPNGPTVVRPIPSDGPYYVATNSSDRTVLLRNPKYGGRRQRQAQRIVFTYNRPTEESVALANQGKIDYLPSGFGASNLVDLHGPLDRKYGPGSAAARAGDARFIHSPSPGADELILNAARPLFRSERLRQAAAYALDRSALALAFNDVPADGIVPPAVPGFGTQHRYPLDKPDLATARRLAGPGRHHAVLYFCTNGVFGGTNQRGVAVLIRQQLARIGIAVSVTSPPCGPEQQYDAAAKRSDLIMVSTFNPLLDPEQFIDQTVRFGQNGSALGRGTWTSPAFLARVAHARVLRGRARTKAYMAIENDLLRAAPIVPYGTFYNGDYFAKQIGCKVIPPGVGVIDLSTLCKHG